MLNSGKRETLQMLTAFGVGMFLVPRRTGTAVARWADRVPEIPNLPIMIGAQGQLIRLDSTFRPENRSPRETSTYIPHEIMAEPYASAEDIGLVVNENGWTNVTTASIEESALTVHVAQTTAGDELNTVKQIQIDTSQFQIGNLDSATTLPFQNGSISATLKGDNGDVSILSSVDGEVKEVYRANGDTEWIVGTAQETAGGVLSQQGSNDKSNPNTPYQGYLEVSSEAGETVLFDTATYEDGTFSILGIPSVGGETRDQVAVRLIQANVGDSTNELLTYGYSHGRWEKTILMNRRDPEYRSILSATMGQSVFVLLEGDFQFRTTKLSLINIQTGVTMVTSENDIGISERVLGTRVVDDSKIELIMQSNNRVANGYEQVVYTRTFDPNNSAANHDPVEIIRVPVTDGTYPKECATSAVDGASGAIVNTNGDNRIAVDPKFTIFEPVIFA